MSRYYINAAEAVRACRTGKSFKGHFFSAAKEETGVGKKEYAIAAETIKYMGVLDEVMKVANVNAGAMDIEDEDLCRVMVYELLFGSNTGGIKGGGKVKRLLLAHEAALRTAVAKLLKERCGSAGTGIDTPKDSLLALAASGLCGSCTSGVGAGITSDLPRYVRLNYLADAGQTIQDALAAFQPVASSSGSSGSGGSAASVGAAGVVADTLIPSLIRLPADTRALASHPWVNAMGGNGTCRAVVQDRASCIPSQVLADEWLAGVKASLAAGGGSASSGGDILDACSAPGNKTTHMASELFRGFRCDLQKPEQQPTLKQSGSKKQQRQVAQPTTQGALPPLPHIFACEQDPRRYELLRKRCAQANALTLTPPSSSSSSSSSSSPKPSASALDLSQSGDIISAHCVDFLSLDVTDERLRNVRYVLLDPSCSGSGCGRRAIERQLDNGSGASRRLQQLQSFQIAATRKAMSFPSVHTVLYSTCSIHEAENEDVVASVLRWCRGSSSSASGSEGTADESAGLCLRGWNLQTPSRFPLSTWHRRGLSDSKSGLTADELRCLIRCNPEDDDMIGFFVALYVNAEKRRRVEGEDAGAGASGVQPGVASASAHLPRGGFEIKTTASAPRPAAESCAEGGGGAGRKGGKRSHGEHTEQQQAQNSHKKHKGGDSGGASGAVTGANGNKKAAPKQELQFLKVWRPKGGGKRK